ncbi:MAG: GNAT family N-acetyltransferase [Candidatus Poseidoniaceae archaeon]|nr:GNAT family N-acetyltransferase [Candidatus Poseidoniaceae archaeon]
MRDSMPPTPNLPDLAGGYSLRPVSKAILPMVIDAYSEDSESAKAALPWLRSDEDITRQLSDMLHDLEHLSNADRVHFWSIHDDENTFIGLIGLGDEMQLVHSNYNLGYWVRKGFRNRRIASNAVDAVLGWLNSRDSIFRIEITVHPRNEAGLITAERICQRWNGQIIDEFIGIELNDKTVPHKIHVIDLPRM